MLVFESHVGLADDDLASLGVLAHDVRLEVVPCLGLPQGTRGQLRGVVMLLLNEH